MAGPELFDELPSPKICRDGICTEDQDSAGFRPFGMEGRAAVVLDDQGIQDRKAMLFLDGRGLKELCDVGIAVEVMIFVGIVDGTEIIFHTGRHTRQAVILQKRQADGSIDLTRLDRRKQTANIFMREKIGVVA